MPIANAETTSEVSTVESQVKISVPKISRTIGILATIKKATIGAIRKTTWFKVSKSVFLKAAKSSDCEASVGKAALAIEVPNKPTGRS